MVGRTCERRSGRSSAWRVLLALVLLAPVLCASPLGGLEAWIHAHGPWGGHVHVLSDLDELEDHGHGHGHGHGHRHDVADHHARPESREASARAEEDHPQHHPAPEGVRIELPRVIAVAPRDSVRATGPGVPALATAPLVRWTPERIETRGPPESMRCGRPPGRARRSGIVALLQSSHALLI